MIVTLTPNPAVDQTVYLDRMIPGQVNRYDEWQLDPAGKGVNVSRMAHRLGWPTVAFGFLAGEMGLMVEKALDDEGVQHHFVHVRGQTRLNVTVADKGTGGWTRFLGPGPRVTAADRSRLDGLLRFWLQGGRVLVLAGRLAPGMPSDAYATYVRMGRQSGALTVLDTDGDALRLGLEAGPTLVKPNVEEAERLLGRSLTSLPDVVAGARELVGRGAQAAVISMGERGAVCVSGERVWLAVPPSVTLQSTVGSGDSLVAGIAVALASGRDIVEGLRLGTAAGAATAMTPGTALGARHDVDSLLHDVWVEELSGGNIPASGDGRPRKQVTRASH